MSVPISPVYHVDENQCPECKGSMVLMEKSIIAHNTNEMGMLIIDPNEVEEVELKYVCTNCGSVYDVEKDGACYHIARTTPRINKKEQKMKDFNPFYL